MFAICFGPKIDSFGSNPVQETQPQSGLNNLTFVHHLPASFPLDCAYTDRIRTPVRVIAKDSLNARLNFGVWRCIESSDSVLTLQPITPFSCHRARATRQALSHTPIALQEFEFWRNH
jgi:hypothetical protein